MSRTTDFTMESFRRSVQRLEWLKYEVDPAWAKFCDFGPDDLGGVWEKLGVIRKRPELTGTLYMNPRDADQLIESIRLEPPPCYDPGIQLQRSPLIPPGTAYVFNFPRDVIGYPYRWID
jgi:hypothetical protein